MTPALVHGDYVLVRGSGTSAGQPLRGQIVVVALAEASHLKRIVGLPGERLTFAEGTLLIDRVRLPEPYLQGLPPYLGLENSEYSLGVDAYFVMGDNRGRSTDSRHFGPVTRSNIEGTVVCRVWPPLRWGRHPRG